MYVRYLMFKSTPDNRPEIERFANEVAEFFKSLNGFVSVTFLVSEDETEYGSFSLWDTKAAAEVGSQRVAEEVAPKHKGVMLAPPETKYFEAYVP